MIYHIAINCRFNHIPLSTDKIKAFIVAFQQYHICLYRACFTMGLTSSLPGRLTEELLEDYLQLTYLTRNDIVKLVKKTMLVSPDYETLNPHHRYDLDTIISLLPELKYNPFRDRILRIFSSEKDGRLSFEDMLDLCSAMSENCPYEVKARWAFQIYDFNGDGSIDAEDIGIMVDRLTNGKINSELDKSHIANVVSIFTESH
ncbi:calcium and integrin-binding family member 3-like isoform X2 [Photinus pyralis]|uniref:calcium and integrin-binding family member 3-like isoform X2 n=1 Tax=Photinus pyralis TaxID=7054 RepID=UPI0012670FB6|nr:calcium and integrin-binding family member 3-like isoform X2 [Photinus pyralis]